MKKHFHSCLGSLLAAQCLSIAGAAVAQTPVVTKVSGLDPSTAPTVQSESAVSVSLLPASEVEVIATNDDVVGSGFNYPTNLERQVVRGASAMGWYFRERTAQTPNPDWSHGRLLPGATNAENAAVIWGDPGIAAAPDAPGLVLQGSLMVPVIKFPDPTVPETTCVSGGTNVGCIKGSVAGDCSPLGGACLARSTDGGKTFAMVSCFSDKAPGMCSSNNNAKTDSTNGHFYDGMDLAIGSGADPAAFIVARDVDTSTEALWSLPAALSGTAANLTHVVDGVGPMGQIGDALGVISLHVRVRMDASNRLWRMSLDRRIDSKTNTIVANEIKVNILGRNAAPRAITSVSLANAAPLTGVPKASQDPTALLQASARFGPQYDFDVGKNEAGQDEMRFVFLASGVDTATNTRFTFVQAGFCTPDLSDCVSPPGWRSVLKTGVEQFHPAIKYGFDSRTGLHHWKVSFYELSATLDKAAIFAGDLKKNPSDMTPLAFSAVAVTPAQGPCPDERGTVTVTSNLTEVEQDNDYWGDYDDMAFNPKRCSFVRSFTDSSAGCALREHFRSNHQHLGAVELPCDDIDGFRKVSMTFNMFINDDDFGDPDECKTFGFTRNGCSSDVRPQTADCSVSPTKLEESKKIFSTCVDDEVTGSVILKCTLNADLRTVHVALTPIVQEGTSCNAEEVQRSTKEFDIAAGAKTGDFSVVAERRFIPTNGSPYDRTEIIVPTDGIVNGTQF